MKNIKVYVFIAVLILVSLSCRAVTGVSEEPTATSPLLTETPMMTETPTMTPTALPPPPLDREEQNLDEPAFITGEITYTWPFFLDTISEAFVMLEDQAGFIERDLEFEFPLVGQVIGPVELVDEDTVTFSLALPAIPQGTMVDVDNNGQEDVGVQIFAIAYWSNTWGGPFLERRDGTGWSTGYASTTTDADRDYEIDGGTLVVWAPDDLQSFPIGFGEDQMLFTADDPTEQIPAGYTLVNIDEEPFSFYKENRPFMTLHEGDVAVKDYSSLSYAEAFDELYQRVSREYPFTVEKDVDWDSLNETYAARIADVSDDEEFYLAMLDFSQEIPDGHIGIGGYVDFPRIFFENYGGSFGMILTELSDGRILVINVLPDTPAAEAGIQVGAELLLWNNQPVSDAISSIEPIFGPYSTAHHKRLEQIVFLTRVPPGDQVRVSFRNSEDEDDVDATMEAIVEYDSLFQAIPSFAEDELALPVEAEILDDSGLGYIKISTFSDDYNLMAQLWDRIIREMLEWEVPGVIIDLRVNGGGNSGLARNFAGYFFNEEVEVMQRAYYNEMTDQFEYREHISRVMPGPIYYDGPIAVLVSSYCVSACEGFTYVLTLREDVTVLGHYPSAGAYGEVGLGQYELPADLSMQFPTGRSETPEGQLLIEGTGITPDILVPVTEESALGLVDEVLSAAVEALKD